ncbi:ef hand family protein [Stylonychia lemnae]|uniref:Ef hand family protein n=1 Tax=Stylonychia lemnae TaxID=5949 RepID=A0A077ZPT4_STYLE|nr:ef hand family protein [Stylonychia lemnae]|eukprot:CDW71908.1 ef hand family protein [Stylonychia lemnae]
MRTDRLMKPTTSSLNHRVKADLQSQLQSIKTNIYQQLPPQQSAQQQQFQYSIPVKLQSQQSQRSFLNYTSLSNNNSSMGLSNTHSQLNLKNIILNNHHIKGNKSMQNHASSSSIPSSMLFQADSVKRQWLNKHGKSNFVDFNDEELAKLRKYFRELDTDGSGSIGLEELEQPLISLGLCSNRKEVQAIMNSVDEDKSGQIEFNEFLNIIKGASNFKNTDRDQSKTTTRNKSFGTAEQSNRDFRLRTNISKKKSLPPLGQNTYSKRDLPKYNKENDESSENQAIYKLFKNLTNGKLKSSENPNIPFQLFLSNYRRRRILDAVMNSNDNIMNAKTNDILRVYKNFLDGEGEHKRKQSHGDGDDPNEILIEDLDDEPKYNTIDQYNVMEADKLLFDTQIGEEFNPKLLTKILQSKNHY